MIQLLSYVQITIASSITGLFTPNELSNPTNPIGIAAGFDKDARVPDAVLGMGCGFAEIGTVTPKPQAGNPQPRVFRLVDRHGLINRLGFNNGGHAAALERLRRRQTSGATGLVGVNIGANKDTTDRSADYVAGLETFWKVASYFMVNISSPNTPGLRDLQAPAALDELLGRVMEARTRLTDGGATKPVFVKIAPDVAEDDLPAIVERMQAHAVDAIAVSNTTLSRPGLSSDAAAKEAGGLSGRPLFHRSTAMLGRVHQIDWRASAADRHRRHRQRRRRAGQDRGRRDAAATLHRAHLRGARADRCDEAAIGRCRECGGVASITALTGSKSAEWAAKPLDG